MKYHLLLISLSVVTGRTTNDIQDHVDTKAKFLGSSGGYLDMDRILPSTALESGYPAKIERLRMPSTGSSRPKYREPSRQVARMSSNYGDPSRDGRKLGLINETVHLSKRAVFLRRTVSDRTSRSRASSPSKLSIGEISPTGPNSSKPTDSLRTLDSTRSSESSRSSDSLGNCSWPSSSKSFTFPRIHCSPRSSAGSEPGSPEWKTISGRRQQLETQLPNPGRGLERNSALVGLIPSRAGIQLQGVGVGHTAIPDGGALYFPTSSSQIPVYRRIYHHNQVVVGGKIYPQRSQQPSQITAHAEGRHVQIHLEPGPNSSAYFETGSGDVGHRYTIVHGKSTQHNFSGPGESGTVRAVATMHGSGYLRITANNHGFRLPASDPHSSRINNRIQL